MATPIQNKDQWSINAESYAQSARDAKIMAPVEKLFSQMNVASPFATATAVLDIGSGPGVTLSRLIETYGNVLPEEARLCVFHILHTYFQKIPMLVETGSHRTSPPEWSSKS